MSAEESIRATIDMLTEAWNKNDMGSFALLFTDDASYVSGTGLWLKGRDAIHAGFSSQKETSAQQDKVVIKDSRINLIRTDVAVVHSIWEMKGSTLTEQSRKGIITMVLVSDGDRWRIAALQNTDTREINED